ncbi:MAG: CUAEP/CCAEP-tail radical SAM (seleno)protein [Terriglobales bacterium]
MNVLLLSTYESGHQPFGLASPAAWLRETGFSVTCLDLSQTPLSEAAVRAARLIAIYLPMHTATRIAMRVIAKLRAWNPEVHLCAYGLYAPLNAEMLRASGVATILGGEFESGLLSLAQRLRESANGAWPQLEPEINLARQQFRVPDRSGLPALERYSRLVLPDGTERIAGYTEASRGCKHLCRHCPIVPVYGGKFRIVERKVVLEDIRRQVAAGAEHITFGDPDFFNGVRHALELVQALHREHPQVSYDVTIKAEHLLKHAQHLPALRSTGCAFVTTAVESLDDRVLTLLDKGHTRDDFFRLVSLFRKTGLELAPTFVAFHPWTTLESYEELLRTLAELDLVENVPPVQLMLRLLIPARSRLLELKEVLEVIGPFEESALSYRWKYPDPQVEQLQRQVAAMIEKKGAEGCERREIFSEALKLARRALNQSIPALPSVPLVASRATIPYLTEPWFC